MKHKITLLVFGLAMIGLFAGVVNLMPDVEERVPQPAPLSQEELAHQPADPTPADVQNIQPTQQSAEQQPAEPTQKDTAANDRAPKQAEIKETVEKEYTYYPLRTANDPGFASSWALQAVNAPDAWDITTGTSDTVVAVIDSGFSLNHDDLQNSWYTNSAETGTTELGDACWTGVPENKQTNDCDDDQNGYVDDWRGWNFVFSDNNPAAGRDNPNGDGVAHGTEVAGLVGAAGNNNTGIATISWSTKVMPLQALSDDGPGFTSDVAAAVYYAVENGADVINMSLGSNQADPAMLAATNYAYDNNVVVVAASGNCGTGTELGCEDYPAGHIGYPARNPNVISVGATDSANSRASFSSYGVALDVVAPGSGTINSPTWTAGNQTSLYSGALYGTSFASPFVASLAALIKAIRPDSSVQDITALILATAQKPTAMNNAPFTNQYGHGSIDAFKAVTVATSLNEYEQEPILRQAGGPVSEHRYAPSNSLGSGCQSETAETYCTIWMKDVATAYDRYLPYTLTNQESDAGWTWSAGILNDGLWSVRASQGDALSPQYLLSRK
ncbi:MAG TPA: S8 family serine peptidase [Candidatus Saccharimonadaceae bacterium]|nr:S8 family serine peptidase [Candidatus Saccharimonadaceae bacterium]